MTECPCGEFHRTGTDDFHAEAAMHAAREPLIGRQQTLNDLLHALANDRLPPRAMQGMTLLLPLAALAAWRGWHWWAVSLGLVALFGVWALCEHAVVHAPLLDPSTGVPLPPRRGVRILRTVAGAAAALLAATLFALVMMRLFGVGMNCAGCAG